MKKPTWINVVGIISIIFAALGILGGGQLIITPRMIDMQKQMMSTMQASIEQQSAQAPQTQRPDAALEMMNRMWKTPDWFGTYCVIAGIAGMLLSGFFLFASIMLIQTKSAAITLYYTSAGIIIFFCVIKTIAALLTDSLMGFSMMAGSIGGIIFYTVLFVIVAISDKTIFYPEAHKLPQPPPVPGSMP